MKKQLKQLITIAERNDWTVTEEDTNIYNFSKCSPTGQDFYFQAQLENGEIDTLLDNIHERYLDFDCSEEAYLWLDETGHGTNGAPYDMKEVYEDMEACQEMILDLYDELRNEL